MSSMDTGLESDLSDQHPVDLFLEERELYDQEPGMTSTNQTLSEDQTYRDIIQGIRSYMGWTHIPDMDTNASTGDDYQYAGPKM